MATDVIIGHIDLPLPVSVGIDWNRHFSITNYLIDFTIWAGVLFAIYKFIQPIFSLNKKKLVALLFLLTLGLTSVTLFFDSPLRKSSYGGGTIWLKRYEIPNQGAQKRVVVVRGFPYNYYHHSTGFDKNNEVLWDYKVFNNDDLAFDLFFWLIISSIILRVSYFKRLRID